MYDFACSVIKDKFFSAKFPLIVSKEKQIDINQLEALIFYCCLFLYLHFTVKEHLKAEEIDDSI